MLKSKCIEPSLQKGLKSPESLYKHVYFTSKLRKQSDKVWKILHRFSTVKKVALRWGFWCEIFLFDLVFFFVLVLSFYKEQIPIIFS